MSAIYVTACMLLPSLAGLAALTLAAIALSLIDRRQSIKRMHRSRRE